MAAPHNWFEGRGPRYMPLEDTLSREEERAMFKALTLKVGSNVVLRRDQRSRHHAAQDNRTPQICCHTRTTTHFNGDVMNPKICVLLPSLAD
jgi:hypothetical protein